MESINRSIRCTVEQCRHHCRSCDNCSLDRISVGTRIDSASESVCTDCMSFAEK